MNHSTQTINHEPLTRSEKFFKRGLPVIATGVAALTAVGLIAQVVTNESHRAAAIAADNKKDQAIDDFNKMLDSLAIQNANPNNVIEGTEFSIPNNTKYLGEEALHAANHAHLPTDDIAESALAISRANLIHPGSDFVLSNVDVDHDGNGEVIVQLAPTKVEDE